MVQFSLCWYIKNAWIITLPTCVISTVKSFPTEYNLWETLPWWSRGWELLSNAVDVGSIPGRRNKDTMYSRAAKPMSSNWSPGASLETLRAANSRPWELQTHWRPWELQTPELQTPKLLLCSVRAQPERSLLLPERSWVLKLRPDTASQKRERNKKKYTLWGCLRM